MLEQGVYSIDKSLERSKLLSDKIKVAEQDREIIANGINIETAREETQRTTIPKVETLLEVYKSKIKKRPSQRNF